jgi:hypothetical protein
MRGIGLARSIGFPYYSIINTIYIEIGILVFQKKAYRGAVKTVFFRALKDIPVDSSQPVKSKGVETVVTPSIGKGI